MPKTSQKLSNHHPYELTANVSRFTENTLNRVDEAANTVQTQINHYQKPVKRYIQKHPLYSLGIAVSIGALLSRILFK